MGKVKSIASSAVQRVAPSAFIFHFSFTALSPRPPATANCTPPLRAGSRRCSPRVQRPAFSQFLFLSFLLSDSVDVQIFFFFAAFGWQIGLR